MEITEVRVKLLPVQDETEKLRGFCSITIDGAFVVRDIKIIQGSQGTFLAMPSRRIESHCPTCRQKNHIRARFCNDCGRKLLERDLGQGPARERLFVDIAHPVNSRARKSMHDAVIREYRKEVDRSRSSGYVFARREDLEQGRVFEDQAQNEVGH